MDAKQRIIQYLKRRQTGSGKELTALLNLTRQGLHKHLKKLIEEGYIVKEGSTKKASYSLASTRRKKRRPQTFLREYSLSGLQEDKAFQEVASVLNLNSNLNSNGLAVARYAFTEMLNNAIDHSQSQRCVVQVILDLYSFNFRVRDYGIGIFYSIYKKLGMENENEALLQLLKGKTTTMEEKHSGEGIFFTSKAADQISFRSHNILLTFDNLKDDTFVEQKRLFRGTEVNFRISRHSRKNLDSIFTQFAPKEFDYRFEKTRVLVRLLNPQYVSRSEAKRLLQGLDKFRVILLDFQNVKSIGQGFSDEIFRVFTLQHPEIQIQTENLSPILEPVIRHVVDKKKK